MRRHGWLVVMAPQQFHASWPSNAHERHQCSTLVSSTHLGCLDHLRHQHTHGPLQVWAQQSGGHQAKCHA